MRPSPKNTLPPPSVYSVRSINHENIAFYTLEYAKDSRLKYFVHLTFILLLCFLKTNNYENRYTTMLES